MRDSSPMMNRGVPNAVRTVLRPAKTHLDVASLDSTFSIRAGGVVLCWLSLKWREGALR
jgi:hypothetical protein